MPDIRQGAAFLQFGPVVALDGNTSIEDLDSANITVRWNANGTRLAHAGNIIHRGNGDYDLGDIAYLGAGSLTLECLRPTVNLPCVVDYQVMTAKRYDEKYGNGGVDANVTFIANGTITENSIASDAITAAKIAPAAIDAATFASDVDAEILSYIVNDATQIDASALNTLSGHDPGGTLAASSEVTGLNVNTRANLMVPIEIETPDASTQVYKIRLFLFDVTGNMEAPDSTPTVALVNAAGTDRSSRLSSASNPSTGVYSWDYTSTAGDTEEQLVWTFTVVEGGATRTYPATSYVVEETAYRFSSSDRANLTAIYNKLPSKNYLPGTNDSTGNLTKGTNLIGFNDVSQSNIRTALGMNGATFDDDMAMVKNIGILAMRKDAGFASDLESSIGLVSYVNRDTNSGAGSFDNTTDSEQAIRDNHPANFSALAITAGGCTTVGTNADKTGYTGNVTDKTGFALSSTGLNALTLTEPTSTDRTSWTFVQHVLAIGLRMFGRRERIGNDTSGLLKTLNTGNTVIGNQTYSAVSNGNETIGNST